MRGYLKGTNIIVISIGSPQHLHRFFRRISWPESNAQVHQRPHPIRPEHAQGPCHQSTPIVPNNEHLKPKLNQYYKNLNLIKIRILNTTICWRETSAPTRFIVKLRLTNKSSNFVFKYINFFYFIRYRIILNIHI